MHVRDKNKETGGKGGRDRNWVIQAERELYYLLVIEKKGESSGVL